MKHIPKKRRKEIDNDPYYIPAVVSLAEANYRVLKHAETFGVFEKHGDIQPYGVLGEQGLYHDGTRFLSQYEMSLHGRPPLLLYSTMTKDNDLFVVDITQSDISDGERVILPHGALHVQHEAADARRARRPVD